MRLRETRLLFYLFFLTLGTLTAQNAPLFVQVNKTPLREPLNVLPGQTDLQVCGLTPGKLYQVIATPAYPDQTTRFQLTLTDPDAEQQASAQSPASRPHLRRFRAGQSCETFLLQAIQPGLNAEAPMYLSVGCLDCEETTGKQQKLVENLADAAGISITQAVPASDLVSNVLIGGDCFDVSGIKAKGMASAVGRFTNGQSSINISEGIVLCTGGANILSGPNSLSNANGGFGSNSADDPHLSTLATGNQYDVSVIEFDFKPTANTVQFDFVFGSEEYCEYVNSIYNDVFGFFISGPGISGTKNLAVLPNGITPVAVNFVNHLTNSNFYRNNNTYGICAGQPVTNMTDIQLDGFTTVLTATANVIPCQTYHIKLAIADIGDANYTSAVFLRANSFNAGGKALASPVYPSTPAFTREGCQNGFIRFYRGTSDVSQPLVVNYTVAPGSTATPGLDFQPLPTSITIPAGQTELLVPVNVLTDQLVEGTESFTLLIDNACSCDQQDVTFVIEDQIPLAVTMTDQTGCAGSATLSPSVSAGGLPPLNYLWSNGATTPTVSISTFGSYPFTVTVTDACGLSATASAVATVSQTPTAILSGGALVCPGQSAQLSIAFTGVGPWTVDVSANGAVQAQTFADNPAVLTVNQPGLYTLSGVVSAAGCPGLAGGTATVDAVTLSVAVDPVQPPCFGDPGALQVSVSGNNAPYTYVWSTGAVSEDLTNLPPGTYTLTVTSAKGCTSVTSSALTEPPLLTAAVTSSSNIDCYQPIGNAAANAQGGTGSYQYAWSNGNQQALSTFTTGGVYNVTVTDANNCTAVANVLIGQNTTPPTVQASADSEITCNTPEVMLNSTGSSVGPNFVYTWSTQNGHILSDMEEPSATVDMPGQYTLLITNTTNGCTASAGVEVIENTNYPTALDLQVANPGCNGKPGTIRVLNVQGGVGPFVYSFDQGNTYLNQATFGSLPAGQYTILVQDVNGCEYEQKVTLTAPVEPEVQIEPDVQLAFGETAELTALINIPLTLVDTIIWTPLTDLTPTNRPDVVLARPFKTSWYTVTVVSIDGCTDQAQLTIHVGDPAIYAPNVIKPGSTDGINNMFKLFARENTVSMVNDLQIFDRWGNMVFARDHFQPNDDRAGGWDGHYRGKVLGPGVFTWWANVLLTSGEEIQMKGDVTIVD